MRTPREIYSKKPVEIFRGTATIRYKSATSSQKPHVYWLLMGRKQEMDGSPPVQGESLLL